MYYTPMYGPDGWSYDEGHLDFAFETLVIPKPRLMIEGITPENFSVSIPQSYTDLVYRVECSTNLTSGAWNIYSSMNGTRTELFWNIPVNSETNRAFFRVTVEEVSE